MRFEPARAIEWMRTFDFPREAGTEGERRAADLLAADLERAGFHVDRASVPGSSLEARLEPWLGWVGLGAWATGLTVATRLSAPWPARFLLAVGAFLWLRLTTVEGFRALRIWPRSAASTSVIAYRAVEPAAPVRVVFHTPLDTFEPDRCVVPVWLSTPVIGLLLFLHVLIHLTIHANPFRLPWWSGAVSLALLWLAILGRVWRLVRKCPGPDYRDNRTGLAVLLELARVWPGGTSSRIETRFATTGGRAFDQAGLRALVESIDRQGTPRPTLVVEWLTPGIGPSLALMEQGTGRLAATAARDLWVPHHLIHHSGLHREHWPCGRHGPAYVGIVGRVTGPVDANGRTIDPDALARTAQLATEVALRWARGKQASEKAKGLA